MLCPWGYIFPRWPPPPRPSSSCRASQSFDGVGGLGGHRLPSVSPFISSPSPLSIVLRSAAKCLPARAAFLKPPRLVPSYLDNHAGVRAEVILYTPRSPIVLERAGRNLLPSYGVSLVLTRDTRTRLIIVPLGLSHVPRVAVAIPLTGHRLQRTSPRCTQLHLALHRPHQDHFRRCGPIAHRRPHPLRTRPSSSPPDCLLSLSARSSTYQPRTPILGDPRSPWTARALHNPISAPIPVRAKAPLPRHEVPAPWHPYRARSAVKATFIRMSRERHSHARFLLSHLPRPQWRSIVHPRL
ncbi:hypothetical protein B0H14DRAFT_3428767 [Mycena olivaceomarginata]|nr:hypothetical protein B0H14DRAFT_3428767 [Mycena olivaceomarginata]